MFGCAFEAFAFAMEGLRASIISITGPSFPTFEYLNMPRVLEGCWILVCAVLRKKKEMLALGGCQALKMC